MSSKEHPSPDMISAIQNNPSQLLCVHFPGTNTTIFHERITPRLYPIDKLCQNSIHSLNASALENYLLVPSDLTLPEESPISEQCAMIPYVHSRHLQSELSDDNESYLTAELLDAACRSEVSWSKCFGKQTKPVLVVVVSRQSGEPRLTKKGNSYYHNYKISDFTRGTQATMMVMDEAIAPMRALFGHENEPRSLGLFLIKGPRLMEKQTWDKPTPRPDLSRFQERTWVVDHPGKIVKIGSLMGSGRCPWDSTSGDGKLHGHATNGASTHLCHAPVITHAFLRTEQEKADDKARKQHNYNESKEREAKTSNQEVKRFEKECKGLSAEEIELKRDERDLIPDADNVNKSMQAQRRTSVPRPDTPAPSPPPSPTAEERERKAKIEAIQKATAGVATRVAEEASPDTKPMDPITTITPDMYPKFHLMFMQSPIQYCRDKYCRLHQGSFEKMNKKDIMRHAVMNAYDLPKALEHMTLEELKEELKKRLAQEESITLKQSVRAIRKNELTSKDGTFQQMKHQQETVWREQCRANTEKRKSLRTSLGGPGLDSSCPSDPDAGYVSYGVAKRRKLNTARTEFYQTERTATLHSAVRQERDDQWNQMELALQELSRGKENNTMSLNFASKVSRHVVEFLMLADEDLTHPCYVKLLPDLVILHAAAFKWMKRKVVKGLGEDEKPVFQALLRQNKEIAGYTNALEPST